MKRIIMLFIAFLMAFSLFRVASNSEPLTLSSFLNILSHFDYDFDSTRAILERLSTLKANFPEVDSFLDSLKYIVHFLQICGNVILAFVMVVVDTVKLLYSVFEILFSLLGTYSTGVIS